MNNATTVQHFIERIWNNRAFEELGHFLHPDFKDHSLPPMLAANAAGTRQWIMNTGLSFEHHTVIEAQVTEGDRCMVKIRMNLKHTGPWRDMEPTGIELSTAGYRYFELKEGKITGHWALIDGQSIENLLKKAAHGCKIAE